MPKPASSWSTPACTTPSARTWSRKPGCWSYSMITISQANTDADIADVRALLREYTGWAFTLMVAREVPPTFDGLEEELAGLPGVFVPPAGRLLLPRVDGHPAGSIALRPADAT